MFDVAIPAVLAVLGVTFGVLGVLGWLRRLPRNRFVGVRTPASVHSAESFALANQVAGPVLAGAGAFAVLTAVVAALAPATPVAAVVGVTGLVGSLVLVVLGGRVGDRVATAFNARAEGEPASGCDGCVFAGGCRTGAVCGG